MVNAGKRNLGDYEVQFEKMAFEPVQASYRRRKVLAEIGKVGPASLLEVGCGMEPLFTELNGMQVTVVEPVRKFCEHALNLADGRGDRHILQGRLEDVTIPAVPFDMIVVSGLLHEVEDPQTLLSRVRLLCAPHTTVHINVPNARSLHRLWAVAMGIIQSPTQLSDNQLSLQQRATYDIHSLIADVNQAGFEVIEHGSLFVKPFTHAQMQHLINSGFMTRELLDGLDKLTNDLPELGSELWCNLKLAHV